MEIVLAYFSAFFIGLILGLMGGGGSILTVPLLVYILGINPVIATAYSLFIVGTTSAFGALQNYYKGLVAVKSGILFAIPSLITVFLTRLYIVPALPDVIFKLNSFTLTKDTFIMSLFAIIMALASYSMLKSKKPQNEKSYIKSNYIIILPGIFIISTVIGIVGSGGGFLIIPFLVILAKLPMKKAIGTSLFIIAINSLIGFVGDIKNIKIEWSFLLIFTFISILGIFVGTYLNRFVNETKLKKGFGWFILIMAVLILSTEIYEY